MFKISSLSFYDEHNAIIFFFHFKSRHDSCWVHSCQSIKLTWNVAHNELSCSLLDWLQVSWMWIHDGWTDWCSVCVCWRTLNLILSTLCSRSAAPPTDQSDQLEIDITIHERSRGVQSTDQGKRVHRATINLFDDFYKNNLSVWASSTVCCRESVKRWSLFLFGLLDIKV